MSHDVADTSWSSVKHGKFHKSKARVPADRGPPGGGVLQGTHRINRTSLSPASVAAVFPIPAKVRLEVAGEVVGLSDQDVEQLRDRLCRSSPPPRRCTVR